MMKTEIKAVVFKTPWLRETKSFYSRGLGLPIVESSNNHFVIHVPGLRFVFVKGQNVEVELYLSGNKGNTSGSEVDIRKDVNLISIITVYGGNY